LKNGFYEKIMGVLVAFLSKAKEEGDISQIV